MDQLEKLGRKPPPNPDSFKKAKITLLWGDQLSRPIGIKTDAISIREIAKRKAGKMVIAQLDKAGAWIIRFRCQKGDGELYGAFDRWIDEAFSDERKKEVKEKGWYPITDDERYSRPLKIEYNDDTEDYTCKAAITELDDWGDIFFVELVVKESPIK